MSTTLTILQGSTRPFDLLIVDDAGVGEALDSADHATFSVRETVSSLTDVLLRRTADGNLSINKAEKKLVGTLSQAEADALSPGLYVGQVSIRLDGIEWVKSDFFHVLIEKSFAPNTAV